jgi:outer membrane receptor protein involved in Fe transport
MLRGLARAAAIAALCGALVAIPTPAAAQHEHHAAPANSAQAALTGTVRGAEGAPLRGAIVQLVHETGPERHLVATSVTDAAGRFVLRAGGGTYTLEIRQLGHEPHREEVTLAAAPVSVGVVRLRFTPRVLDPMTVSAERDAVELRSGATVVHARASAAAGGSIADLLRTVPGVEMDAEGRVGMRGSTNVLVLMNGRRIPLTGDALVSFLRQMPATALERIDAGTTASARQDGDGAAGVVNLVFRDDAARGGMRSLAGSVATGDHYMGSAAASGDLRDLLTWDATYSLSGTRPRTESEMARWNLVPRAPVLRSDQDSRARERHRLHSIMAGAVVTPVSSVSLALRGTYAWMEGAYRNSTAFVDTDTAGDRWMNASRSLLEHAIPSSELSAVASVERGRVRFTTEGRTSLVSEDFRGDYATGAGYRYMTTVMTSRQREHVIRNDLGLRVAGIGIDVGQQSRLRTITAEHDATHDATHDGATLSRAFHHEADVHAGYLAAHRSVGGVRTEAGLRFEADHIRMHWDSISARTALRLFPSISGEWTDARRTLVYRFAYGRRIDRPGPEMLNPFSMGEDDMNEVIGNPSLRPEVSDQFELGMERPGARLAWQLTPFLRWTRDPIRPLKTVSQSGRSTTTLENLTRTRAAGADGSVRARLSGGTVVTVAGSVARMQTTAASLNGSGLYATARLIVDLRLAENTTAQLYAYRSSAQAIEQGEILPAFTSELALTRRLAGDRGRVTLRLNDPLRSDRLEYRIADSTFAQESRRRTARPLLSLFASWTVGGAPREDAPVRREGPARIF